MIAHLSKREVFMSDLLSVEQYHALHIALATEVIKALQARQWTISAAESCTGGLFLAALTEISGSSSSVTGGVVCYSNQVKEDWVGVEAETLRQFGAVSEQTGRELAQGIRTRMNTTLGIGITGIAGPGGGSADKPVGLVYIGFATPTGVEIHKRQEDQGRYINRAASVEQALQMVLAYCAQNS
jgi:PncC family amidohydrolase